MHVERRRTISTAIAAAVAVLAVAACGGSSGSGGSTGAGTITVYSGQHEQTATLLSNDFKRRTGIAVRLRSSDEASLANQIIREGGSSPADVFFAENPPALTVLGAADLLGPVDGSTLGHVAAPYSSPRGNWVGVSARSAVLVYNTRQLAAAALPASLLDLSTPAWKGKLGFAPTETDFQPLIAAIVKLRGQPAAVSWLEGLKRNGEVYDDNETLVSAVNRGQVAAGLIDHYYWYRLRDEVGPGKVQSALHYFAPADPGALVDVSGAAVLKSSRHAALAQRFLAYLVSAPAQQIIAHSESYEYPLGSGVTTAKPLRPFTLLKPPPVSIDDLGDGRSSLMLLQQVGLI
jgi:iron(III) transport system substrate-binding protein